MITTSYNLIVCAALHKQVEPEGPLPRQQTHMQSRDTHTHTHCKESDAERTGGPNGTDCSTSVPKEKLRFCGSTVGGDDGHWTCT